MSRTDTAVYFGPAGEKVDVFIGQFQMWLWRTTTRSLQTLGELLDVVELDTCERETIRARLGELQAALDAAPKSMKWKARNRVGDRVPWYELPEDPDRAPRPA